MGLSLEKGACAVGEENSVEISLFSKASCFSSFFSCHLCSDFLYFAAAYPWHIAIHCERGGDGNISLSKGSGINVVGQC